MAPPKISRQSFLKLVGLGLTGSWLAACAPIKEIQSTVKPASLSIVSHPATSQPLPSVTLRPPPPSEAAPTLEVALEITATPTSAVKPTLDGVDRDVLTNVQKERLALAGLRYQADSQQQAIQVARSLGYLESDGHPASMCGPLAAAILRDAGLISAYVDLHDFWLLNPRQGQSILERVFPKDAFTWYQSSQSISEFDFKSFPLQEGDFIYLFAGDPGSFEHMLTVTRVDPHGRAYTVTNFDTPEGFIIQEVLLYDPNQATLGKFYDWTNRKNSRLGLTGFGGFLLVRFEIPVNDPGPKELAFSSDIDAILEASGGVWRIFIKEINGPVVYARQERHTLHPASVIKVPIAMLFFKSLEELGVQDYTSELKKGIDGRSYNQLLRAMLVNSEEKATLSIERAITRNRIDTLKILQSWGVDHTYIAIRQSTAREMGILFEGLYSGNYVAQVPRQIILDYLSIYTPGDDTRLGAIRRHLPEGNGFFNKRGTITDELLVVADTAVAIIPANQAKKGYVVAAFAYQGKPPTTYTRLESALGQIAERLWHYTQEY